MRRGFTILELMMVLAIIAVLSTIITTAASMAIRSSRSTRAEAMRPALQASIATYQAADPEGKWPGAIENLAESGESGVLTEEQSQNVFRIIVQRATGQSGNTLPLIDPNGLYVAPDGIQDGRGQGRPFSAARQGDDHHQKLAVARMVFGYQGRKTGNFHRFNVYYNAKTDTAVVSTCCSQCMGKDGVCGNYKCPKCHKGEQ